MDPFDQIIDLDDGITGNPFEEWEDRSDERMVDINAIVAAADQYDETYGKPVF